MGALCNSPRKDDKNYAIGQLKVQTSFDFEALDENPMKLRIRANNTNFTGPPRSGEATVYVYVTDLNDNTPKFKQADFAVGIKETTPANAILATFEASDLDADKFGVVKYKVQLVLLVLVHPPMCCMVLNILT